MDTSRRSPSSPVDKHGTIGPVRIEDIKAAIGSTHMPTGTFAAGVRNRPRTRRRVIPYRRNQYGITSAEAWQDAVYDLAEISRVADIESALAVSFRKHRELLLKEGFRIECKDDAIAKRVKVRLMEISLQSGRSFEDILREVATNLIKFHTAFIYLRRDKQRSTGHRLRWHGKELEPIAALEVPDPTTMRVAQNKSGNITEWQQYVAEQGDEVKFAPDEIICITMDRKSGFIFGTPYCLPVLDDILALRRLEELVEVISAKHAFPLYHYKVGTEKKPSREYTDESGNYFSEVEVVKSQVEEMPSEGAIVTSERHEIQVLGAEGEAMDLSKYINHFRERMLSGLRLSDVDVGRGDSSNRGTATVMKQTMADAVKDYQAVLAEAVSFHFLNMLALEEGFDLNPDTEVKLIFPPVDTEEARAKENHVLNQFTSHAISQDELRIDLGRDVMTESDWSKSHFKLVEEPLSKMKSAMQPGTAAGNTNKNKTQPKNQHGTSPTKPKVAKNDMIQIWRNARERVREMLSSDTFSKELFDNQVDEAIDVIGIFANSDLGMLIDSGSDSVDMRLDDAQKSIFFRKLAKKELRRISSRTKVVASKRHESEAVHVIDAMETELSVTIDRLVSQAWAFGALEGARLNGDRILDVEGHLFDTETARVRDIALAIME